MMTRHTLLDLLGTSHIPPEAKARFLAIADRGVATINHTNRRKPPRSPVKAEPTRTRYHDRA